MPADQAGALWDRLLPDERAQADRPRRARFAAPRGRPAALRPRPRRDHLADRGQPGLRGLQAPARRPATSPAPRGSLRELAGRLEPPRASACGCSKARRPARAPRSPTPTARSSAASPAAASRPRSRAPIAMGYVPAGAGRARRRGSGVIVRGKRQAAEVVAAAVRPPSLRPQAAEGARRMRFTKDHEWVEVDGDVATIGITAYAAEQLGDVVFVELPAVGKAVKAGDALAVVESVKAASDVYAPVSGEVVEVNAAPARRARDRQRRARDGRLVRQAEARQPRRTRRPDGPRRLRSRSSQHALSEPRRCATCPSPPHDRAADAGRDRRADPSTRCSSTCPRRRALAGPVDLPPHQGELEVERALGRAGGEEPAGGRGAVLLRRRRLSPPRAGQRRPHHPALGVPDHLHALPAGDRPGHAAGAVRVPDPGRGADRHGGRQRLDVRRLDRLRRGGDDGRAGHQARQGGALRRPAPALRRGHRGRWPTPPGVEDRRAWPPPSTPRPR